MIVEFDCARVVHELKKNLCLSVVKLSFGRGILYIFFSHFHQSLTYWAVKLSLATGISPELTLALKRVTLTFIHITSAPIKNG